MAKPHWSHLDVATLDFNDSKTWDLICAGHTSGIFQIEGAGMTDVCRRLQPRGMEDLIAILALYRPDSMSELEHFIRRKNGVEEIVYLHDDMIPILIKTYGCLIYQEQVMAIVRKFGNYSHAEADKFRKGIGKKDKELVKKEAHDFYTRCVEAGYSEEIARKIADFLEKMGGYLFNKGHSTGYAILSFKTAYLKAHFPVQFMCALISNQKKENGSTNYEKIGYYVYQSKLMNINVLNPNVNTSGAWFKPTSEGILYGMNLVKGVGQNAVDLIERLRPFNSFEDFMERASDDGAINKTVVIALIKSGGFDFTKRTRGELLKLFGEHRFKSKADDIKPVQQVNKTHIEKMIAANIVRGAEATDKELCVERWNKWRSMKHAEEWEEEVMAGNEFTWEYDTISYHLKGNPFEGIDFTPWDDIEDETEKVLTGGTIIKLSKTKIKRGRNTGAEMAFLSVETQDGVREVTVFQTQWASFRDKLVKGAMVVLRGKKQGEGLILNGMMTLDEYKESQL